MRSEDGGLTKAVTDKGGDDRFGDTGAQMHLTSSVSLAGHWTTVLRTKKLAFQKIEKRVLVHRKERERSLRSPPLEWSKRKPCCLRKLEQDISPVGTVVQMHFQVP